MSVKKWHQLAEEKSAVDQQTQEIHQKFKMDKINKDSSQLSGEEPFKPIPKRLDEKSSTNAEEEEEEEEQEGPDYTMDEFDRTNPFGDEFRPDTPTPASSPPTTPTTSTTPIVTTSQPPPYQEFDDLPLPPPPLMEETVMPGSSKDETKEETSKRLRTVKSILSKYGSDPTYEVKSKGSKYYGYDLGRLKAEEFKLETIKAHQEYSEKLLKRTQPLSTQLQEKKVKLKPPKKQEKRETAQTPLEKAVMSRRPYLEPSDNEEDFSEQDWETEGSGIADEAEKLINQLYLSLASKKAGNNSMKLKKQIVSLLDSLVELGIIDKKQKKKLSIIIYFNNVFRSYSYLKPGKTPKKWRT